MSRYKSLVWVHEKTTFRDKCLEFVEKHEDFLNNTCWALAGVVLGLLVSLCMPVLMWWVN